MTTATYTPVEMLEKLVGFDTTSRESNLNLIHFVEAYLAGHGVASTLVFNDENTKANLVATVGPDVEGGVVLSGHSDVVPVDGQVWSTEPFTVLERDGKLYGRGTCDMKGFIAVALALVPEFQRAGLTVPVHIVLTYDEETDCAGAMKLMDALPSTGLAPHAVIIGEPTLMEVANAHKGHYACKTRVVGREAHSSLPHIGVNAIRIATELVRCLESIAEELEAQPCDIDGMEPPHTTINVGRIRGGVDFNIVPGECSLLWDIRPVPGADPYAIIRRFEAHAETLKPAMQSVWPSADISNTVEVAVPAFLPEDDSPAETLVKSLMGTNRATAIPFGTEAPCYQEAGMSVVVFGPGSIEQAHKPDEFIAVEQVDACVGFIRRLMARLAASPI